MPNKEWALAYAKIGWPVFPVTGFKTPFKGSHGHLDASTDPAMIERWWTEKPTANLAVALGDIVVVDVDGPSAIERLRTLCQAHGGIPRTAVAQTAKGFHFYFKAPVDTYIRTKHEKRAKSGDDGIDIKAHGGWSILPPSKNARNGFVYKWVSPLPLSELPTWLLNELNPNNNYDSPAGLNHLGKVPNYLNNQSVRRENLEIKQEYSENEHARLASALQHIDIKSCGYDDFLRIGMALRDLDWERSDGTSIAFELWDAWCSQSEHYNQAGLEAKWKSFGKRSGTTLGTIFHLAKERGWTGLTSPLNGVHAPGLNGHAAGPVALPAAFLGAPIHFPDTTDTGNPRATCTNAGVALQALQITCEKDQFHEKMLAGGHAIERWAGDLSDDVIQMLRKTIRAKFNFDPGEKNVRDACIQLCLENQYDPVLDYLDSLTWDRTPRLDTWLIRYMGAADTELNRVIGRLVLIAAVRRQYEPGTKFDQIVVLESKEGFGKSSAIEILAGKENFSDQSIINKQEREQQEAMCGVWLYEIADLTGMKKADVEHIKAFASRTTDRARPAYGRFRLDRPRRTIFFATTNDDEYLRSQTGNRRFWPVPVGKIDLAALKQDRDQLWAEAVHAEASGESITLPERLWKVAGAEQEKREESDFWFDEIAKYIETKALDDVSTKEVLVDNQFIRLEVAQVGRTEQMRAASILKRLGFQRYRKWHADRSENRFRKEG